MRGSICCLLPKPISPRLGWVAPNVALSPWSSVVEPGRWDTALPLEMGGETSAARDGAEPAQEQRGVAAAATFNHIDTSGSSSIKANRVLLSTSTSLSCGQRKVFISVLTRVLVAKARSILACGAESWPCCPSAPAPPGHLRQGSGPGKGSGPVCTMTQGLPAERQQQELPAGKMLRKR